MDWEGDIRLEADDELPPVLRARGSTAQHWGVDTSRIRAELGYREFVSRADSIRRSVDWEAARAPTGFSAGLRL